MADESHPEKHPDAAGVDRRGFFTWLGFSWTMFSLATATGLAGIGRFFFPNVLFEPPSTFKAGAPDDFAVGEVDERFKDKYGVWIVRTPRGLYALRAICTHLGCTPNWLGSDAKFKCPCHGSGFYMTGVNFEGPAPRPLERVGIALADDGQILIDKGRKFQFEMGQWDAPDAFLPYAADA